MGRISLKTERRSEIILAFARVMAKHGFAGATMVGVAEEAGISPGLLHHYFRSKNEMLTELTDNLIRNFHRRIESDKDHRSCDTYIDAALKLDERADSIAAKCWVSVLAEALRDQALMEKIKKFLDTEIEIVRELSGKKLDVAESSALISYVMGCLVFGAFAPKRTSGFAAGMGKRIVKGFS